MADEDEPAEVKKNMTFNVPQDGLADMPDELKNAEIGPMLAISAIALNMAMKYHDIATIQDGALYQQFKLEGRNIRSIGLNDVFETAIQIEKHLVASNRRVAQMIVASALGEKFGEGTEGEESEDLTETSEADDAQSDPPTTPDSAT